MEGKKKKDREIDSERVGKREKVSERKRRTKKKCLVARK